MFRSDLNGTDQDPTPTELAQIEREWPLIEAGLALVDAEIAHLTAGPAGTDLVRRKLRRAEARFAVAAHTWADAHPTGTHHPQDWTSLAEVAA